MRNERTCDNCKHCVLVSIGESFKEKDSTIVCNFMNKKTDLDYRCGSWKTNPAGSLRYVLYKDRSKSKDRRMPSPDWESRLERMVRKAEEDSVMIHGIGPKRLPSMEKETDKTAD